MLEQKLKLNKTLCIDTNVADVNQLWGILKVHSEHKIWRDTLGLDAFFEKSPLLMLSSVTHSSFYHENSSLGLSHNERLEFIGDAFLDAEISLQLWERFPELNEGELSKFRSSLVNENVLAQWGRILDMDKFIFLGRGEADRDQVEKAIVADAFEAILGAIGLIDRAQLPKIIEQWMALYENSSPELSLFSHKRLELFDPKTKLQEFTLGLYQELPEYSDRALEDGQFECELSIKGKLVATEVGKSKKKAQIAAAKTVLIKENYKNL